MMTLKQATELCREVGMRLTYNRDWNEYRVTPANLPAHRAEAVAYYTDDRNDAVATAFHMARGG